MWDEGTDARIRNEVVDIKIRSHEFCMFRLIMNCWGIAIGEVEVWEEQSNRIFRVFG